MGGEIVMCMFDQFNSKFEQVAICCFFYKWWHLQNPTCHFIKVAYWELKRRPCGIHLVHLHVSPKDCKMDCRIIIMILLQHSVVKVRLNLCTFSFHNYQSIHVTFSNMQRKWTNHQSITSQLAWIPTLATLFFLILWMKRICTFI